MRSVYDVANLRLKSLFSVHQYLGSTKWDSIAKRILELEPAGAHYIQVPGRLDIASYRIYKDPMLDWILMVYNGIRAIGNSEGVARILTATITLAPGSSIVVDESFVYDTTDYLPLEKDGSMIASVVAAKSSADGITYVDLDGNGINDLTISLNGSIDSTIINSSAYTYKFIVNYQHIELDDYLGLGTELSYPSLEDIRQVLNEVNAEEERKSTGFARL